MKKIYMILAAMTLLTLSLNAQQLKVDQNGKVVLPKASTGQVVTPSVEKEATRPDGYFRMGPLRDSTTPVTPPYSNGFANSTEQNWWQVIDANSDGKTWTFSSQRAVYSYHGSNTANDWLITAPVYLEAGKVYKFYIDASIRSSTYPEKLEVKLATTNTETALSAGTTIIGETTLTSQTATTLSNEAIVVSQTGNYYFGIHAISAPNMWELYLDNLVIDVTVSDPSILVSTNTVNLHCQPNGTATETVVVTGLNLTTGITATVSGQDANLFSVSPASLNAAGGNLTVTYSPTAVGTHTATITLSNAGANDVTITVNGTCKREFTVCDGTNTGYLPVYGSWVDDYQINQMIYPEINGLIGNKITSMTFYAQSEISSKLGDDTWVIKLGTTNQTTVATSASLGTEVTRLVPDDIQQVYEGYLTTGSNTLTITFDTPFEYNGGNLLLDFEETYTSGDYNGTQFLGLNQGTNYTGFYSYSGDQSNLTNGRYGGGSAVAFLPKVTFEYEPSTPVHDLGIALSVPSTALAGDNATITATVTNNGNQTETGYTVTITAGGTSILTQTVNEELLPHATKSFTVQYPTTLAQVGTTVNFAASVNCTNDADASNNNATASMDIISMPAPENVQATGGELSGTMTWNAPSNLPSTTVTENFEDTSVFPPFSAGGVTATQYTGAFGDWALYDATGGCAVYGSTELNFENESEPHAWFVFNVTGATGDADEGYADATPHASHGGDQYLESICPTSSSTAAGVADHWLISPELSGNAQEIIFWDSELTTRYGAESYEIWVSTTDNTAPASFTKLGDTYTTDYITWAERRVQLPAGTKYFAIRHISNDIFGLLIDDVTYEVPIKPVSYNVYLDGQLVGNVDAETFTYTFNNVSQGEHQCAVSAVYPNGLESAAVPATFTSIKTATIDITPETQTINDETPATLTITGTDVEGNINVSVGNDWTVNPNSLGSNGGDVNVTYTGRELSASTTVTASATGATDATATVDYVADLYIVGDYGTGWNFNNGTQMSYNNGIYTTTLTVDANSYILFARLLGNDNPWNTRDVFGPSSNGNWWMQGNNAGGNLNLWGSSCIYFPEAGTYYITVNANDNTFSITRQLEGQTAIPTITSSSDGEYVTITATGDGIVTLNVPGYAPVSGEGEVSITVPCGVVSNTITVSATAQETGKEESDPATAVINIPAGSDWIPMDGTYNATDLLSFQKNEEDIMLIDQFAESTLKNDHPDHYTYTLRQTVNGETETSTPVTIPVYKTSSTMQGLYTQNQVTGDTDMKLKPNVFNTEMDYEVNPDRNVMYYSLYRGAKDAYYPEINADQRISQLQKFDEMVNGQVQYFMFENHQTGIAPRYNHVGVETVERLDTNWVEGDLDQMLAYVPVIWTNGLYTARGDGKDNSYGSDIKREYMGKVTANITGQISDGAFGTWEDINGTTYRAFHPTIVATGYLPQNGAITYNDEDQATYVPFLCRAWCTNEGIHDYGRDADGHLEDRGELPTPFLLGEATFGSDMTATIGGDWTEGSVRDPWSFALPASVIESQVTFKIRFYYKKVVTEGQQNGGNGKFIGGAAEEFFMAETEGDANDMIVGINEFMNGIVPVSVTYVNPQGMQSSRPFDGVNIVVTRYSDGTTRTSKIIR